MTTSQIPKAAGQHLVLHCDLQGGGGYNKMTTRIGEERGEGEGTVNIKKSLQIKTEKQEC